MFFPSRCPLLSRFPEVQPCRGTHVNPRLARLSVFKPPVCPSDRHIENEVEVVIKGRVVSASKTPWIIQTRTVTVSLQELALLPKWLVEEAVHDLKETIVDVREDVLLAPLEAEGVEAFGIGCVEGGALDVVTPPSVIVRVRPPMERTADDVVSALSVCVIVSARLHNIDLTRLRPWSVCVFHWQHPDRRPKPIARWQVRFDFNPAKLDTCTFLGIDTSRVDRVDDRAVREVGADDAIRPLVRRADALLEEVGEGFVVFNDTRILDGGLDPEHSVFDECVLVSDRGLLELTISRFCQRKPLQKTRKAYPNPPTSASFVHTAGSRPLEKSSIKTGQYS